MKSAFADVFDITSDITGWDVSSVSNMQGMFNQLHRFDQNIGGWDITNVTSMTNMLNNVTFTKRVYDNIIRGWNAQSVQYGVDVGANTNHFCNSADARDSLINDHGWSFTGDGTSPNCVPFVTTWQTTDPAPSIPIRITIPTTGTGYDYDVDIGNDGSIEAYGVTGDYTHDFATVGSYEIAIYGDFPRIYVNDGLHADKLLSIDQWGDIEWQSMKGAFKGCQNMVGNYSVRPDLEDVTDMTEMFAGCSLFNQGLDSWELFGVTHMTGMFSGASLFNRDFSSWDFSSVTHMAFMLNGATTFDQDLSAWDISSVEHMDYMLDLSGISTTNYDATLISWSAQSVQSGITLGSTGLEYCEGEPYRQSLIDDHDWTINGDTREVGCFRPFITTWVTDNPGSCTTCIEIPTFNDATYNYDIDWENDGIYDTIGVTGSILHDYGVSDTFQVAIRGDFPMIYFNDGGDAEKIISIDQWGDIQWKSMFSAFRGCINLNGHANDTPDLSNVTSLAHMFWNASSFNQDIGDWLVNTITSMSNMFHGASSFNQDIGGWSVENVTDMIQMFASATVFNQDIGDWEVINVTSMSGMFRAAISFNQDISGWEIDSVTIMSSMFFGASSFNQDIGDWDVGNITKMNNMFHDAESFNQDISGWDISKVTDMDDFLDNSGMSINNYDALINGWEASGLHMDNVDLDADGLEYCTSGAARQRLMDNHGWTFDDDGPTQGGVNDWLGNSALNWNDSDTNWSSMTIPSQCHDVTLPLGSDITVQSGQSGYGGTLDIEAGGIFEVKLGATLDILFIPQ